MRKLATVLIVSLLLRPQAAAAQPRWDLLVKGGWSNANFWVVHEEIADSWSINASVGLALNNRLNVLMNNQR